jgi:dCTP deaminase
MAPETANGIAREHSPVPFSTRKDLLSLDLDPTVPSGIVGYRAKHHAPTLDFDCIACHDRLDFWEPVLLGELHSVVLAPDDFFLLRSKEKVVINPSEAAELTPYDPSFGEFRVHYAGFLDPGFGFSKGDGTPVVLEVRTRDVAFLIEHAQKMAWVLHYQLDNVPDKIYGKGIGSAYYQQGITPGKQFKD